MNDVEPIWSELSHAYGPAVEVPSWLTGSRNPAVADDYLYDLGNSLVHQGTRYSATPAAIPALVRAAARLGAASLQRDTIDELCDRFRSFDHDNYLRECPFLWREEPSRVAGNGLTYTPDALRGYTNEQLLDALSRGGVCAVEPLDSYLRLNVAYLPERAAADWMPRRTRDAVIKLLRPFTAAGFGRPPEGSISSLEERGLPGNAPELAAWLADLGDS